MTTLFAVPVHVGTGPITSPATTPEEAAILSLSSVVLTGSDADWIKAALTATIAPATRAVYTCVWGIWERWCQTRGLCAMPADPATICAYLAERADQGVAAGTLTRSAAPSPTGTAPTATRTRPSTTPSARSDAGCDA